MASIEFRQVETVEDLAHARSLVVDYLNCLNDRVRRQYDIEFEVGGDGMESYQEAA